MIWVITNKSKKRRQQHMGLQGKEIACLFLLLLVTLHLEEASCSATDGSASFTKLRGGGGRSARTPIGSNGVFGRRNGDRDDKDNDDVFGVDKRRIHTGKYDRCRSEDLNQKKGRPSKRMQIVFRQIFVLLLGFCLLNIYSLVFKLPSVCHQ